MARQVDWGAIEARYEAPLKDVLIRVLNEEQNMTKAGQRLGQEIGIGDISSVTILIKCQELNILKRGHYYDGAAESLETQRVVG